MIVKWGVLTMILVNWIIPPAIGVQCYVCDSGMEDCRTLSSKSVQYLKDCGPKAISCATITVEAKGFSNPKGRWFQRICFFKDDEFAFSFTLDYYEMLYDELNFKRTLQLANSFRSQQSFPLMANNLPKTSPLQRRKRNLIKIHSCWWTEVKDGCNDWEATPIFPLAEGYPMQEYRRFNKLYGNLSCYYCHTNDLEKTCHLCQNSTYDKVISNYGGRIGSGGCALLSISMNNKSSTGNYVERDLWYPGDSWCLNRGFNSSPSGKTAINYFKPEGNEGSCRTRFISHAIKHNSSLEYTCSGKRVFYSAKELNDFKRCRNHVRGRMGYDLFAVMSPDDMFRTRNITEEQNFKDEGEPYAKVYFKFCGGMSACNFEAESKLVEELDESIPEISGKLFNNESKSL